MTIFELAGELASAEAYIARLERENRNLLAELHRLKNPVEEPPSVHVSDRDPDDVDAVCSYFGAIWTNYITGRRFVRKAGLKWEELCN